MQMQSPGKVPALTIKREHIVLYVEMIKSKQRCRFGKQLSGSQVGIQMLIHRTAVARLDLANLGE
jgi:hypothetical protein